MYKRILVPLDGSRTAQRGLSEAIGLAKSQKARLRVLHVVDQAVAIQYPETMMYTDDILHALEDEGRKVLAAAQTEVRQHGIRVETVLHKKLAPVAQVIVQEAKAWRADIIVLGTHGRRGVRRLVLGSDAESVVRSSPVPVLLICSTAQPRRKR